MTELIAELFPRQRTISAGVVARIVVAATAVVVAVRTAHAMRVEAAATASDILSAEPVVRMGLVANVIGAALYGALQFSLHHAVAPLKLGFAIFGTYFQLVKSAVYAANVPLIIHLAPLFWKLAVLELSEFAHAFLRQLF